MQTLNGTSEHITFTDLFSSLESQRKRVYYIDYLVLKLIYQKGYGYSGQLAKTLNRTRRCINKHLRKLEDFGFIERVGRVRCCFQWYRVNRRLEIPVIAILEHLEQLWKDFPLRTYFNLNWVIATVPSSYWSGRDSLRPAGSIPFGVRCVDVNRYIVEDFPTALEFWIPTCAFDDVLFYLDEIDVIEYVFFNIEEFEWKLAELGIID